MHEQLFIYMISATVCLRLGMVTSFETQASFSSLSEVHWCSGDLQMAPSSLGKQTANYELPHDWMMNLSMNLAALCDI